MARPRYEEDDARAVDLVAEAFWGELRDKPYEKISAREVIRRAGINKNTFYYHFENLGQLAQSCVDDAIPVEFPRALLAASSVELVSLTGMASNPAIAGKLEHIGILLSGNGSALQGMLLERVVDMLYDMLPCSLADGPEQKRLLLGFAAGGIVNTLRGRKPEEYASTLTEVRRSPSVSALMNELKS